MSELLKRRRRIAEVEVRCYISQLVSSLKYLHSQLVIHRDLKLGNLFLDSELRIKVGDFGLAAKLSHPTEKRRTICGTPNYIAPEILEGKEGHSFEVDIWSAGVVMYTLLVGTPPFESKDVKSTYKRILCNSFAFPDNILISEDAKHLIRSILQPKPEQRPTLDQIMAHPFFTRPTNLVPSRLPECALFQTPQKHQLSYGLAGASTGDVPMEYERVASGKPIDRQLQFGDENDPQAINKARSALPSSLKPVSSLYSTRRPNVPMTQPQLLPSARVSGMSAPSDQHVSASPRLRDPAFKNPHENPFARLSGPPSSSSTTTNSAPVSSSAIGGGIKSLSRPQAQPALSAMSEKFEIFIDKKKETTPSSSRAVGITKSPSSAVASSRLQPLASRSTSQQPLVSDRYSQTQSQSQQMVSTSTSQGPIRKRRTNLGFGQIGDLEQELENVHLNPGSRYSGRHSKESSVVGLISSGKKRTPVAQHSRASKYDSSERLSSASAVSPNNDSSERDHSSKSKRKVGSGSEESPSKLLKQGYSHSKPVAITTAAVASTTAHFISPEDLSHRPKYVKTPGTLEAMHEMLDLNYPDLTEDEAPFEKIIKNTSSTSTNDSDSATSLQAQSAHTWVVRYVDFTSKYGLGFLLNTGAAGVYFNDSTKIVLSANGEIFQYIERKRASGNMNTSVTEHISQTHSIHMYPVELQKKVTLMCHFRNYLMDQTKVSLERDDQGTGMDEHMKLRTPHGHNAAQAASATVKLGTNSAQYIVGRHDNPATPHEKNILTSLETYSDSNTDMIYLKKWVRTKHAILFRLSNRTVQVVFFDRSEVLMSSEVKTITYVSKLGERSYHSLNSVMQSGRKDIAKRLKYTKDIMHRLISIQQPK